MRAYTLTHLSDAVLLRELAALVAQDRTTTAAMLAHIAEVDARKLYLPAGYSSMFAYCVSELRLSEENAFKRIHAARTARRFPAVFDAISDGRLHLSAVVMLAPALSEATADQLLKAAAHKTKLEIEQLLAQWMPRLDVPSHVRAVSSSPLPSPVDCPVIQHAPGRVELTNPQHAPAHFEPAPRVEALAPERFALQLTMNKSAHDKLRYAQELLSHQTPSGDIAEVFDRALDALIEKLEKRKFAETSKPRTPQPTSAGSRYVPAHVKRAVWKRDRGQCTFVSDSGHRCAARKFLEFDHVEEFARGGRADVEGIRLRCRAHNQYTAERTFGAEFMSHKRRATSTRTTPTHSHTRCPL